MFDWWSKYDASRAEEAKTAEEKVMILSELLKNDGLNSINFLDFIHTNRLKNVSISPITGKSTVLRGQKKA